METLGQRVVASNGVLCILLPLCDGETAEKLQFTNRGLYERLEKIMSTITTPPSAVFDFLEIANGSADSVKNVLRLVA